MPGKANEPELHYHLAFLEFTENGNPYPLDHDVGSLPHPIGQLKALTDHLGRQKRNYVLVFAHGWRHDASIGDGAVSDLRVYAAHAARFLADRCKEARAAGDEAEELACDTEVTGVLIGWRGARVDEQYLRSRFGWLGDKWGNLAALLTLFDRKPVSETVGPSVSTALQQIDRTLKKHTPQDKMIVFGHSLGGNLFATALKDILVKAIHRHDFRDGFDSTDRQSCRPYKHGLRSGELDRHRESSVGTHCLSPLR